MQAQRITSLLASGTEILYGLGLGDSVVGISHECDYPEPALHKPRVTRANIAADVASRDIDAQVKQYSAKGQALYTIDADLLARLAPDLIVTQSQCEVCAVSYSDVITAVHNIPSLRNTHIVALNPTSLEEVLADIQRVAEAASVSNRGRAYVDELRSRIDRVRQRTVRIQPAERPRTACIEWIEPVMLGANWMPDLIDLAGGRCELAHSGDKSTYASWEEIVHFDPEVVVVMPCGFDLERTIQESALLPGFPDWFRLTAVRTGRVFAVDGNALFNRSGPRLIDSLELLAHLVQPNLFPVPPQSPRKTFHRLE